MVATSSGPAIVVHVIVPWAMGISIAIAGGGVTAGPRCRLRPGRVVELASNLRAVKIRAVHRVHRLGENLCPSDRLLT